MNQFDVYLIGLDPTKGKEIKKTRPCVIISPNEMNKHLGTVIVAPMTTSLNNPYPCRVQCQFQGKLALIVLDQIQSLDKIRLIKKLGSLHPTTQEKVHSLLQEIFSP